MVEFENICSQLNWKTTTPAKENVLRSLLNISNIKVVILGQDPYPTSGVANGYAFAVNKDVKIPASLAQIFREIQNEFGTIHTDRTLESWTRQGVLLLNTALTTKIGMPGAHAHLWKNFTTKVITQLGLDKTIVWVLWGNGAKKYQHLIRSQKIVLDAHPSPLSRQYRKGNTFKELRNLVDIKW